MAWRGRTTLDGYGVAVAGGSRSNPCANSFGAVASEWHNSREGGSGLWIGREQVEMRLEVEGSASGGGVLVGSNFGGVGLRAADNGFPDKRISGGPRTCVRAVNA